MKEINTRSNIPGNQFKNLKIELLSCSCHALSQNKMCPWTVGFKLLYSFILFMVPVLCNLLYDLNKEIISNLQKSKNIKVQLLLEHYDSTKRGLGAENTEDTGRWRGSFSVASTGITALHWHQPARAKPPNLWCNRWGGTSRTQLDIAQLRSRRTWKK